VSERLVLYSQRLNPFTQKVAIGLDIKGLAYEREVSEAPEDLRRWSPVTGQLPVLSIAGRRVADSTKILRAVEEHYPQPPLWSSDPKTAAAQDQLMHWADASFLFYWDRWRAARYPRPGDGQPPSPSLLAQLRRRIERSLSRPDAQPTPVEVRELQVLDELAKRLDDLVGMLGQRPFFLSDAPSVADASIVGMLRIIRNGPMMGGEELVVRRPTLEAYVQRMAAISPHSGMPDLRDIPVEARPPS